MAKSKVILILLVFMAGGGKAETLVSYASRQKKLPVHRWYNSYEAAMELAREKNMPVFIDFHAAWCRWCVKLNKEVLGKPEIREKLANFICIRVDTGQRRDIAYAYGVSSLPRLISINTKGEIIGDWLGYREPADMTALLDDVLEYAGSETGGIKAPEIKAEPGAAADKQLYQAAVDLEDEAAVLELLGDSKPSVREAAAGKMIEKPEESLPVAIRGLQSDYLGIRIASWKLINSIKPDIKGYDPWAKKNDRMESVKKLKKILPAKAGGITSNRTYPSAD